MLYFAAPFFGNVFFSRSFVPGFIDHCRRETTRALGSSTRLGPDVTMWRCSTWINWIYRKMEEKSPIIVIYVFVLCYLLKSRSSIHSYVEICRDTFLEDRGFQSGNREVETLHDLVTFAASVVRASEKKEREMIWARFAIPLSHIFGVGSIIWSQYMDSVIKL